MLRRALRVIATLMLSVIVGAAVAWAVMAIWIDGPQSRVLTAPMAGGLVVVCVILAAIVRPLVRGLVVALLPVIVVALWWTSMPPSNTRDWTPDVVRTARAGWHRHSHCFVARALWNGRSLVRSERSLWIYTSCGAGVLVNGAGDLPRLLRRFVRARDDA
jgi:hypothetical protein